MKILDPLFISISFCRLTDFLVQLDLILMFFNVVYLYKQIYINWTLDVCIYVLDSSPVSIPKEEV